MSHLARILVLVALVAAGCQQGRNAATVRDTVGMSARASEMSARGIPISTTDLVVALGPPEHKVPGRELRSFLTSKLEIDTQAIPGIINHIQRAWDLALPTMLARQERSAQPASIPGTLDHADLWLYEWERPHAMVVSGFMPREPAFHVSYVFMIQDDHVVASSDVPRP